MQKCDVCGTPLGIMNKFRCENGCICKACYKKASLNFTETIKHKDISDIKERCNKKAINIENFEITGRIGNYIMFDEKHKKLCITNNRITQQKVEEPEIYNVKDIIKCTIDSNPKYTIKQLQEMMEKKENRIIDNLQIIIYFKNKSEKEIKLLHNPISIDSYAFRKIYTFAIRIQDKIQELMKQCL